MSTTASRDDLTDDERSLFERIAANNPDDEEIQRLCELVLQSSASREVTNE
jgi:hypothetical protein